MKHAIALLFVLLAPYAFAELIFVYPGDDLDSIIERAKPGDVIEVMPGVYEASTTLGDPVLNDGERDLVIRSVVKHAAIVRGFYLQDCDNITISGFLIEPASPGGNASIRVSSSNHTIEDNYIRNTQMRGGEDGAIWLNWRQLSDGTYPCKNIVIRGNYMERVRFGLQLSGHDLLVEDNEVNQLYNWDWHQGGTGRDDCDYIRGGGSNIVLRNNWFHGAPPNIPDDPFTGNAHVDGWQSWNYDGGTGYIDGLLIEGCVFDGAHQGMLLQNRTERRAYKNITIRDSVYNNCTAWVLSLGGAENVRLENNRFYNKQTMGVVYHDGTGNSKFPSSGAVIDCVFGPGVNLVTNPEVETSGNVFATENVTTAGATSLAEVKARFGLSKGAIWIPEPEPDPEPTPDPDPTPDPTPEIEALRALVDALAARVDALETNQAAIESQAADNAAGVAGNAQRLNRIHEGSAP